MEVDFTPPDSLQELVDLLFADTVNNEPISEGVDFNNEPISEGVDYLECEEVLSPPKYAPYEIPQDSIDIRNDNEIEMSELI